MLSISYFQTFHKVPLPHYSVFISPKMRQIEKFWGVLPWTLLRRELTALLQTPLLVSGGCCPLPKNPQHAQISPLRVSGIMHSAYPDYFLFPGTTFDHHWGSVHRAAERANSAGTASRGQKMWMGVPSPLNFCSSIIKFPSGVQGGSPAINVFCRNFQLRKRFWQQQL